MATTTITIGVSSVVVSGQALKVDPFKVESIGLVTKPSAGARTVGNPTIVENNRTFSCTDDLGDIDEFGVIKVSVVPSAEVLNKTINCGAISVVVGLDLRSLPGLVMPCTLSVAVGLNALAYVIVSKHNWVGWSKIGELSFVIDKTNEAGYRPMDWNGTAWQVKKLGDNLVVYGANGITVMNPVSEPVPSFGFENIAEVGIKSPYSVAGNDFLHYFITQVGDLWRLSKQGPERLGFAEFLAPLTNPLLVYQEAEQRLFISDGVTGYCFSEGMGGGYASLTGISNHYVASSAVLTPVPFSLMTDTLDLGHRGLKTITFVEVGIDTDQAVYVALDFRYAKTEAWRTSDWVLTNPEGVARVMVSGLEFRARVKQLVYDEVKIDYINLRHCRNDKRFLRGPISEQPDQGGV